MRHRLRSITFLCVAISIGVAASVSLNARAVVVAPPSVAPGGLTATAGNAKVALSWTAVSGATGYRVFQSVGGAWGADPIATTSRTTLTKWGFTNGTLVTFKVVATNRGGMGPASNEASALPLAPVSELAAAGGDRQVLLTWQAAPGATSYSVLRGASWQIETQTAIATGLAETSFIDTGLTNGTRYYYRVVASAALATSTTSTSVSARPLPPPPPAPLGVSAAPANSRVQLSWQPVADATSYRIYATSTDTFSTTPVGRVTTTTFRHSGLANGTTYSYQVASYNMGGEGPRSPIVQATPVSAPPAVSTLSAEAGDARVTLTWTASDGASTYNVFRSTRTGRYSRTALATDLPAPGYVDTSVVNGPTYYYTVVARSAGGDSPRSNEASATPEGPPASIDPNVTAAFRFLRQATWGPRQADIDRVKADGVSAFIDEQLAAPISVYPDALFNESVESSQEHFMRLALTGSDQLRQRVAWALHKIWVVSAVEVPQSRAMVTYYRLLMDGALGNYRDLMRSITLNPAMGRYLNMLNNRSQSVSGMPPNENYPRELLQLFTLGTARLNPNGTPILNSNGMPDVAYTEQDVLELSRILTGWTFGDGNPARAPRRAANENYGVPMEAVAAYHDTGAKTLLGTTFPAGATAVQDLELALDVIFNHPNVGPFVSRQLIQQLVTSNPTPGYVAAIAAVFNDNGAGVRGDLAAVVKALLMHAEAQATTENSGKLSEPVLFVVSMLRALNASVSDHPFMSDKAEEMGQKVFYPNSVFSYFSPGFRVRGTVGPSGPLIGPEFQILTSVTSLVRVNFVGALVAGHFNGSVSVDYAPFTALAGDAAALVDHCNLVFTGGRMTSTERRAVIDAVRASALESASERVRTAVYLSLVIAQSQVDR